MPERPEVSTTSRSTLIAGVIAQFRANGGAVGGSLAGTPLLLLHHVGVRSGLTRVTPVAVSLQTGDGFVVIASNGGSARHPSWYFNLTAHPIATVEFGTEVLCVSAEELHGTARDDMWKRIIAHTS